jgi:hypothetical protein
MAPEKPPTMDARGSRYDQRSWIYDRLRKVVRQDLRNPESEIRRTLDMAQLRFKEWEGRAF